MKSIYVKLVLSFIITILLSVVITVVVTTFLSKQKLEMRLGQDMVKMGEDFIDLYGAEDSDKAARFLSNSSFIHFSFIIIDDQHKEKVLGQPGPPIPITPKEVDQVLEGKRYSNLNEEKGDRPQPNVVGLPFQENGRSYALFIQSHPQRQFSVIQDVQNIQLITILLVGIVLFAYVSTIIIKPIKRLSTAMKVVGKGEYNVQVEHAANDEIGLLTKNFNQMTKELNKIETMRQEFIASVSHEIQSPLTSIRGFSAALKDDIVSEDKKIQYLTIIEKESTRLSQLSSNLLKLASLDSEHQTLMLQQYRLDEQIRHVVMALEPQWIKKNIEIDLDLSNVQIEADKDLLEQVWLNLVTNAIKYTPEHGFVTISISLKDEKIEVKVKDNGIGIAEEDQKYIFESFYKVDKSRTLKGSGLGLAITKKIVRLHEGSIHVESKSDQGSTFTVTLPIQKNRNKKDSSV
ncbi:MULTISPECIES: sensor histidine kinase [Priestia]|uniref:histidine kinase n=1 Tax=Priestia aryabhattai TaxID=412384 RepID=A0AAX6N4R8_PRIAR|nr:MULTISPECIES: HAMP domain-containing sensor histidine kinase [Priestia]MBY0061699.1 HAMP domain-containing histidine kinase [Priestia aryabhattai]MDN3362246.1 HAMP domain-containing sensor histidine kinase [Priestia megaterium]MDU9690485.1 HAMP domain-containing sensor histidine kinase [Priestia aryabhattai]WKU21809.1 HAMP domain-containing sensor histidine kinase [Priestia megaterium]SUV05207.1 two-component sensor histidine kinase [Priestia megaterium]